MPEIWKPVPGWEGAYEVSDCGRVRSVDRVVENSRGVRQRLKGRILKHGHTAYGYPYVNLCRDNSPVSREVHALVAAAFIGPRPDGYQVCHNDGDPLNNQAENLRYDSAKGNQSDRSKHGTDQYGDHNPIARLTWDAVLEIRQAPSEITNKELAERFGVHAGTVGYARRGRTWVQ